MSALATRMMRRQIEKLDSPPVGELYERAAGGQIVFT
jgi:hypothetical protein